MKKKTATGKIAKTFVKDLLIDPTTRGTTDIRHRVVAAASSSSISHAQKFVSEIIASAKPAEDPECAAYGSYADLVEDRNVDIVYVATPHSHHYQNVMLCLSAGKAVLCEKAFTVNAAQARILYQTAREKNLFLMEAVWTRCFPLCDAVGTHIRSGDVGEVLRVHADLSVGMAPEECFGDVSHRILNKDLAGGCLLDMGIYSLTWIFLALYHTRPPPQRRPPTVKGVAMTPEPRTGVDEMTTMLLEFPTSPPTGLTTAHAIATTALRVDQDPDKLQTAGPAIRIQGTKGEIQVYGPAYRPSKYRIVPVRDRAKDEEGGAHDHQFDLPAHGHGMFWEADEAARCWRDKKLESDVIGWDESVAIMDVMDEVRRQAGLTYPHHIESTDYPIDLKPRTFVA